jgi:hypothetical protein
MDTLVDALGNPIVIGGTYGYSTNKGGWSRTVVGTAMSTTPTGRVSLQVIRAETFLYGNKSEYNPGGEKSSIRSHMLFPVQLG